MVITIAFHENPDEILYSFTKVGDSVCIGRDKSQCEIALGVNAQGVSRIHLKLELLSNGRLLVRDTSTYGTGYDGGPFVVEKEKELGPFAILQIGSFFFVIKETVKQKCEEEAIANPFLRIARFNERKRLISNKPAVVVEEECVTEKRRVMDSVVKNLIPGMNDSEREVARNREKYSGLDVRTVSSLSADEAWIQEQDRKLVAKLGRKVKEKMDGLKLDYYRRIADFLPSDDEDNQESEQNKSKIFLPTTANSSRNVDMATRLSLKYNSSNRNTCDVYFPTADISLFPKRMRHDNPLEKATEFFEGPTSMKIVCENAKNDPMLVGPEGNGILDDINPEKLSKSPSSSTRVSYSQKKFGKSINEMSNIEKNNSAVSHSEQCDLQSQSVTNKLCDLSAKKVLKKKDPKHPKVINKQNTIATGLTAWLGLSAVKKRSNQSGNQTNTDEIVVVSKRLKTEVLEDENEREGSEKNINRVENRAECEISTAEDYQTVGMNIDVLRMKLSKAVQYKNLERPVLTEDRSQSCLADYLQETNCKRFRKAAQGSHGGCRLLHSAMRILGIADLIDSKEIA